MTCLVGKNESGKTAVLRALHRLQPDDPDERDFDVETEYPRQDLFDYKPRHATKPDNVVTTWWQISNTEATWITTRFGESALTNRDVVVSKGYDNIWRWTSGADEKAAVQHLVDASGLDDADKDKLKAVVATAQLVSGVEPLEQSARRDKFQERLQTLLEGGSVKQVILNYLASHFPAFV